MCDTAAHYAPPGSLHFYKIGGKDHEIFLMFPGRFKAGSTEGTTKEELQARIDKYVG